jgi:hypothetical protein
VLVTFARAGMYLRILLWKMKHQAACKWEVSLVQIRISIRKKKKNKSDSSSWSHATFATACIREKKMRLTHTHCEWCNSLSAVDSLPYLHQAESSDADIFLISCLFRVGPHRLSIRDIMTDTSWVRNVGKLIERGRRISSERTSERAVLTIVRFHSVKLFQHGIYTCPPLCLLCWHRVADSEVKIHAEGTGASKYHTHRKCHTRSSFSIARNEIENEYNKSMTIKSGTMISTMSLQRIAI